MNKKFDLDDIALIPEPISRFSSRSFINPFFSGSRLPIINAPMFSVINDLKFNKNIKEDLYTNKINICEPRTEEIKFKVNHYDSNWHSLSLDQIEEMTEKFNTRDSKYNAFPFDKVLIDIANGHSQRLINIVKQFKDKFKDKVLLMVGNIGNPETYKILSDVGADYIRLGIGSGSVCTTSTQTAIHYPLGSLIKECYEISKTLDKPALIVADGGMKSYSDIIKSLALGADLVMIGNILAKALESDNAPYLWKFIKISNIKIAKTLYNFGFKLWKRHYGMSTKEVQRKWG